MILHSHPVQLDMAVIKSRLGNRDSLQSLMERLEKTQPFCTIAMFLLKRNIVVVHLDLNQRRIMHLHFNSPYKKSISDTTFLYCDVLCMLCSVL